jgi:hypothetical protein
VKEKPALAGDDFGASSTAKGTGTALLGISRYFSGISKGEGLRANLYKRRLVSIALDVGVEQGADGGIWGFPSGLPETGSHDLLGNVLGVQRHSCLSQYPNGRITNVHIYSLHFSAANGSSLSSALASRHVG